MLHSLLRRAATALGLGALLLGSPAHARAPQSAKPAMWSVSDADTTIYLFGTIHLLPDRYKWRTARFDEAVKASRQLIVETIIDDKNPGKIMAAMASLAFNTPNLPPLLERVPAKYRPRLRAAIKKSGLPPPALDRMETWAAAFMLLGNQFRDMKLKGEAGVETVLRHDFLSTGRPIGELETNVQQFSFFDTLPEKAQVALLEGAIDDFGNADTEFKKMLAAWAAGDVKAIARTFDRDLESSPELAKALIHTRNANWSRWIGERMTKPGAVMVAVGAGHLAGNDSVIAMLQRDGYRVRRIQ